MGLGTSGLVNKNGDYNISANGWIDIKEMDKRDG